MGHNGGVSNAIRCLFSSYQSKPGCQLLEESLQSHPAGSPPDLLLQHRSCASTGYEPRFLFTQTVWITTYPRSTLKQPLHQVQEHLLSHPGDFPVLLGLGNEFPVWDRSQMLYTDVSEHARAQRVDGETSMRKPFPSLLPLDFTMA